MFGYAVWILGDVIVVSQTPIPKGNTCTADSSWDFKDVGSSQFEKSIISNQNNAEIQAAL